MVSTLTTISGPDGFDRRVTDAATGGHCRVLIDLATWHPFDSRALAALVSADKTVRAVGGGRAVAGRSPDAMELLRLTGLDGRLDLHRTAGAAADSLRES